MKTTKNIIYPTLAVFTLAWFTVLPQAQGVSPAPDGAYPGGNTAEGQNALFSLTTGGYNTAVGYLSLRSNTTNSFSTAIGAGALFANTGEENTATGAGALFSNTTGTANTADGAFALFANSTASGNTAIGGGALFNATGSENTAVGASALSSDTTGGGNVASGSSALSNNTSGNFNIAIGEFAGGGLTTGGNNIDIGYSVLGVAGESNTIRIGNTDISDTYIRGISGATVASGAPVLVAANGHLGTMTSSARFKRDIKPMDKASDALLALKPVTFRYKKELDPAGIAQFGLVAEEVEKVDPDLVVRDEHGKPYSVRYEAVNAMLLNEFLKEHKKVEKEEAMITRLTNDFQTVSTQQQNEIQILSARLKEQAAQIQKVSARLEASKLAPQVVRNP